MKVFDLTITINGDVAEPAHVMYAQIALDGECNVVNVEGCSGGFAESVANRLSDGAKDGGNSYSGREVLFKVTNVTDTEAQKPMRTINAILKDARQELYKHGTANELTEFLRHLVSAGGTTVDGARNLVTMGQFVRMLPIDSRRRVALAHYLFDSEQPNGVKCDLLCRIDVQYTKRAADGLVRRVQDAKALVAA